MDKSSLRLLGKNVGHAGIYGYKGVDRENMQRNIQQLIPRE